jgi:hypothetical protein
LPPLDDDKLKEIVLGFGQYPEKYRTYIWKHLLRLPENQGSLKTLVLRGTHSAFAHVHETYPIKSRKLLRILQK